MLNESHWVKSVLLVSQIDACSKLIDVVCLQGVFQPLQTCLGNVMPDHHPAQNRAQESLLWLQKASILLHISLFLYVYIKLFLAAV